LHHLRNKDSRKDRDGIADRCGRHARAKRSARLARRRKLPIEPTNQQVTGSAKCECESLHPRIEKLNLELPLGNGAWLSDQQIQPLFGDRAVSLIVNIDPVSRARRLAVNQNAKSHGSPRRRRAHYEVKIAGMETKRDSAAGLVQYGPLVPHRPIAGKRPMIEPHPLRLRVNAALVE
jgi:hypothetical protein